MGDERGYGQRGSGPRLGDIEKDAVGRVLCRWCRKPVAPPRKTWCSQLCVDEYLSRAQWPVMRAKIIERDQHNCQICGGCSWDQSLGDRYRIRTAYAVRDDERMAQDLDGWGSRDRGEEWARRRGEYARRSFAKEVDGNWPDGSYCRVEEKLEVDHIVAVKDGGTDDPSNLRTLCVPCHKKVTADQRARWASQARQVSLFD